MKNRTRTGTRFLSIVLAVMMVVGMLPATALAAEETTAETTYVAEIGEIPYATLQAAINTAANDDVITLLADVTENVTVVQAPDVAITIDGADKIFSGTITVDGKSAAYETAGLTIKNVEFDATNITKDACINLGVSGDNNTRYTSNVTVENCTFTGAGNVKAAIKNYTGGCKNLTIKDCTATGMHSLVQVKGVAGLTVSGGTINGKNGISVGTSTGVKISNVGITATGYGVRADGEGAYNMTVENCTITADLPVVVRKATGAYDLTVTGGTLTAQNDKGYAVVFTNGDDGTFEVPTGSFKATIDEGIKSYPMSAYVAQIGETQYTSLKEAIDACKNGETITLLADIELTDTLTVPADATVTLDLNGKTISQTKEQTAAYSMITNNGNLTIKDSVSGGKISYTDSGNGGEYVSNTILNNGTLTVEGGTIENLSSATVANNGYPQVIDTNGALTVKGGNIYCANYSAIRIWCTTDDNTSVIVKGGTMTGSVDLHNVNDNANKGTLVINGGTFEQNDFTTKVIRLVNFGEDIDELSINVTGGTVYGEFGLSGSVKTVDLAEVITVSGGTFESDPYDYLAKGYTAPYDATTGLYGVKVDESRYMAKVGDSYFATLGEAVAAAGPIDGAKVELLQNVGVRKTIVIDAGNVTIDLNGMTINGVESVYPVIRVQGGANVTVMDSSKDQTGTITNGDYVFVLGASDGTSVGNLTIESGKYVGNVTVASVTKGTLTITGGEFSVTESAYGATYLLNCVDANYADGSAKIVVKGGTFVGFNPADNEAETGDHTDFVAAGYVSETTEEGAFAVDVWDLKIDNKADLLAFQKAANAGNTFSGKTITLTADVDLGGMTWTPIKSFAGTFDGGNKTISNFKLDGTNGQAGFFVFLGQYPAAVKNLTLSNVTGTAGANRFAILAATGHTATVTNVHIADVKVTTIHKDAKVGAIYGYFNWTSASNCTIENFEVDATAGAMFIGGFAGWMDQDLTMDNVDIDGFKVTVSDTDNDCAVGGFTAQTQTGHRQPTFSNCDITNLDITATGTVDVGGFIADPGAHTITNKCTVAGKIDATGITAESCSVGGFFADYGWNNNESNKGGHKLTNCSADVDIITKVASAGGFVGSTVVVHEDGGIRNMPATLTGCTASGDITAVADATANIGGFAGTADRGTYTNCSASGTVTNNGTGHAGQFVGELKEEAFENTYKGSFKDCTYTGASTTLKFIGNEVDVELIESVAEVGGVKYTSLKTALEACKNGETVKLIADITYDADDVVYAHGGATGFGKYDQYNPSIVYIGGTKGATEAENQPSDVNAVLDLNGHTITNNADAYLFLIMDNAKVTFTDSSEEKTGAVISENESYPAIWACGTDTLVTIEDGTYQTASATGLIHATHSADLVITGGHFSTTADDASLLLMINSMPYNNPNYFLVGVATLTVKGGTFVGFNPEMIGDDYGEGIKFVDGCAEGFEAVENADGTYGVQLTEMVKVEVEMIPGVWGTSYITVENWDDLAAALGENTNVPVKVTLLEDIELTKFLTITGNKTVELNLNGHSITRATGTALYVNGENTVVTINGEGTVKSGTAEALYVNAGTVKVMGGTFTSDVEKGPAVYVINKGQVEIHGGTFSNGNGEFVLNEYDKTRDATSIIVMGGMFKKFDPKNNASEGAGTNFCDPNYTTDEADADGWYTVIPVENFQIRNKADLVKFAQLTNAGNTFSGKTVQLMDNIDLEGMTWTPIASFAGNFVGNNHTISNFHIDATASNAGFFNVIAASNGLEDVKVKDLTLSDITATVGAYRFGTLANSIQGVVHNVTVKNVAVTTTHTNAWVGGMCAFMSWPWMTNCTVENLVVDATAGAELIGGFACILQKNSNHVFDNLDVKGFKVTVTDTDSSGCGVGGFVTQTQRGWEYPKVINCDVSDIDVTATGLVDVGGFIAWPGAHTTAEGCTTKGKIDVTGVTSADCFAGGFFGNLGWNGDLGSKGGHKLTNCSAAVEIITKVAPAGGFVGSATNSNNSDMPAAFTGCSATGTVTLAEDGTANIGGFAGEADRGTYTNCSAAQEPFIGTVADGSTLTNENSYVASVDGVYYADFDNALDTAKESVNKAMTLLAPVVLTEDTTIDLGGVTISSAGDVFIVRNDADVTITGNGVIKAGTSSGTANAVWADGGDVVIENGTYSVGGDSNATDTTHQNDVIYTKNGGTVVINGGTFLNDGTVWTLNENDSNRNTITVKGGTFHNWNPANNVSEGEATSFVPAGYISETADEGATYTVRTYNVVAQIGEVQYETLADAIAAADAGDTITLLANVTENVTIDKSLTIDGANFKYTGGMSVSGSTTALTVKNVNFVDYTETYAITTNRIKSITVENCTLNGYDGFLYANKSTPTVVVKNVTMNGGIYGMHWVYGTEATLENVKMINVTNGLLIQNYAGKTINIKDSEITSINIWERSGSSGVQTFNFEGANTVAALSASQYAKYVLADTEATLTAPEGANVTTTVEGMGVLYRDGKYLVGNNVAQIGDEKYESLQAAINAAQTGDTVVLMKNIDITGMATGDLDDLKTLFVVDNKTITVDLNGKTISGAYTDATTLLVSVFLTDNNGHLTLKNGTVDITGGDMTDTKYASNIYSLIANYEEGCSITIESGTYKLNKAHDCLLYTGGDEGIIIKDGTFELGNVGDGTNGKPWIFNALGGNQRNVIVNGGTFNSDVNHQFWANEVFVPETKALKNNGKNTWTVVDAVAYAAEKASSSNSSVRNVGYATLAEAVEAKTTEITLLTDNTEEVEINRALTIYRGTGRFVAENISTVVGYEIEESNAAYEIKVIDAVAMIGETPYATVAEALNAAQAGEKVVMVADATENFVMITNGVTLDLNGQTLTADYVVAFGGQITDSTDGTGLLTGSAATIKPATTNTQLPIYDAAKGGYRFFNCTVENLGAKPVEGEEDKAKFGFRILFEKSEAYDLLALDTDQVKLSVELDWPNATATSLYTFADSTVNSFAKNAAPQCAAGEVKRAVTLTVTGLEQTNGKVDTKPVVETDLGVTIAGEWFNYSATVTE